MRPQLCAACARRWWPQGSVLLDCGLKSLCPRVSLWERGALPQPSYCLRGILTSGRWAPAWAFRGQAPLGEQGGPWPPAVRSVFPLAQAKTWKSVLPRSPCPHPFTFPSLLETQTLGAGPAHFPAPLVAPHGFSGGSPLPMW